MSVRKEARVYHNADAAAAVKFVDNLKGASMRHDGTSAVFDSAAATDFIVGSASESGQNIPTAIASVIDDMKPDQVALFSRAVLGSAKQYEADHGCTAPPDLIHYALEMAGRTGDENKTYLPYPVILDSATSQSSDSGGLQPNRAVVAILSSMGAAIPFAMYLPADIKSRQAKLAIIQHEAGVSSGGYAQGDIMDGVYSGDAFTSASRIHSMFPAATSGNITGKITAIQTDFDSCDQTAPAVKLVRGRSLLYIQGTLAAQEFNGQNGGSGNSTVSGSVTISGVTYQIGGVINTDTGVIALTSTPALPTTVPVSMESFLDFERDSSMTPSVIVSATIYNLYATTWRVTTRQSPDARFQLTNELGLDPYSESVMAIQSQMANERHYECLYHAKRLAVKNVDSFDFQWLERNVQLNASSIFNDLAPVIDRVSQNMANQTLSYGVSHLYVGTKLASFIQGLPSTIFESSGIVAKPYVYRIGRLFGKYDVYYSPKGLNETSTSAEMLCIGKAPDVTRNPIILGDSVPPIVTQLAVGDDLKTGAGVFGVRFTGINPHPYSSNGAALITIVNLY